MRWGRGPSSADLTAHQVLNFSHAANKSPRHNPEYGRKTCSSTEFMVTKKTRAKSASECPHANAKYQCKMPMPMPSVGRSVVRHNRPEQALMSGAVLFATTANHTAPTQRPRSTHTARPGQSPHCSARHAMPFIIFCPPPCASQHRHSNQLLP